MAKTDRLLRLMNCLRLSAPPVRAKDLAIEMSVSPRSIYRDIEALRKAGAIIEGEPGYGYILREDPALPPMMFSQDETEALVLGLKEVAEIADPVLAAAANQALVKIRAVLPASQQPFLEHSVLHAKRYAQRPPIAIDMAALRQAARDERVVHIHYYSLSEQHSRRDILPLAIVFMDRVLVLLAWCRLRADFRSFRIDRIETLLVSDESFRPRRVSLLQQYLRQIKRQACPS